ncbi:hypothetical protein E4198_09255 [Streptomyces sp. RKND-216]|uniref:hypothetical protein n=1 Tax=Streptomyces sp. RKND-216 TaxID=2562581 RepID=UPI00109DAB6D|nr:hypothetical protein [Streptomyces sp. RKND-216]THA24890.1 hypothetical protein E4198_09255 [Streptomyces sp. RKND-216]
MTDRRRRTAHADTDPSREDNPFAAPPEGRPDRPWQPRRPKGDDDREGRGDGGPGGDTGAGPGEGPGSSGPHGSQGSQGSPWGGRWSTQQPGRQDGGFGGPRRPDQGGDGGRKTPGMRWDPTDPKQRHARYALHGGIWGLFFAVLGQFEIGLLLGALSVYWGVSALRGPSSVRSAASAHATAEDVAGTDRTGGGGGASRPAGTELTVTPAQAAKARRAAAISGLVAGGLALLSVVGGFTQRMVYEEYYTCRQDALTQAAREQCEDLPDDQVPFWLGEQPSGQ